MDKGQENATPETPNEVAAEAAKAPEKKTLAEALDGLGEKLKQTMEEMDKRAEQEKKNVEKLKPLLAKANELRKMCHDAGAVLVFGVALNTENIFTYGTALDGEPTTQALLFLKLQHEITH